MKPIARKPPFEILKIATFTYDFLYSSPTHKLEGEIESTAENDCKKI